MNRISECLITQAEVVDAFRGTAKAIREGKL